MSRSVRKWPLYTANHVARRSLQKSIWKRLGILITDLFSLFVGLLPHLGIAVIIWLGMVGISIYIVSAGMQSEEAKPTELRESSMSTQATAGARSDEASIREIEDKTLAKYWVLIGFISGISLVGSWLRIKFIKRYRSRSFDLWQVRTWLPSAAKAGLLCGGLAYGTLGATVAIIQATVTDEQNLPVGSLVLEKIVWMAFALAYLAILTGYFATKDQITKKP